MNRNLYNKLLLWAAAEYPGFQVRVKEDSKLMSILGALLFWIPFANYATTIGSKVYIPRRWFDDAEAGTTEWPWRVLAHEIVHVHDKQKMPLGIFGFSVVYLFPQVLAVLALLSLLGFALGAEWAWTLLFLLFLAPIPAVGRAWAEKRGYAMSMAANYWANGHILLGAQDGIVAKFTGPDYYFMWPFKKSTSLWAARLESDLWSDKLHDTLGAPFPKIRSIIKTTPNS